MFALSPVKLLVVLVVAMLLVGPDKLPQVSRQIGAGWRAFRDFHQKVESQVRETVPDLPPTHEIVRFARSPLSFLDTLAAPNETRPDETQPGELEPLVPDPGAPPTTVSGGSIQVPDDPNLN